MKLYLSSYRLGNKGSVLQRWFPENGTAYIIPNALDFSDEYRPRGLQKTIDQLAAINIPATELDLRNYFHKTEDLQNILDSTDLLFVTGGNVFDLRIAMKLSGFDMLLGDYLRDGGIYAGYSAGVCVLSPTLRGYELVDPVDNDVYREPIVWDGLGVVDWMFAPHYKSDHPESADVDREVAYYKKHAIKYRALPDGEVIIIEDSCEA